MDISNTGYFSIDNDSGRARAVKSREFQKKKLISQQKKRRQIFLEIEWDEQVVKKDSTNTAVEY